MSNYYNDLVLEIDDALLYDNYVKISIVTMVIYSLLDKMYKKKTMKNIKTQTVVNLIEDEKMKIKHDAATLIQRAVHKNLDKIDVGMNTDYNLIDLDNEETKDKKEVKEEVSSSYMSYIPLIGRYF